MDRTRRRQPPADPDEPAIDRKLLCLTSWLERTNQRESQALQARAIVPAMMLTFVSMLAAISSQPENLSVMMVLCLSLAFGCFLYQDRKREIWKSVAVRLQTDQRILLSPKHVDDWPVVGNTGPDRLFEIYEARTPMRPFSSSALAIYFAAFLLTIFLVIIALPEGDTTPPSEVEATKPAPAAPAVQGKPPRALL